MASTRKRDASSASVRLTTKNYNRKSLLSNFHDGDNTGRPTRSKGATSRNYKDNDEDSSDDPLSTEETHKPERPEPATDDDPMSTTDDESETATPEPENYLDPRQQRTSKWSARDLETKLAQGDVKEEGQRYENNRTPARTPKNKRGSTPRTAVKRENDGTPKTALRIAPRSSQAAVKAEDNSDEEGAIFTLETSYKRRKGQSTYRKRTFENIHAGSTSKDPAKRPFKPPLRSPERSDTTACAKDNGPAFRQPLAFSLDGLPSSSFPTDSNNETLFDLNGSISSFSSAPSSMLDPEEKTRFEFTEPEPTRCPICSEIVSDDFVKRHRFEGLNVRRQMKFCRAHRIWTAKGVWVERKYPTIDWESLDKRIESHLPSLEDILMLRETSSFRKDLGGSEGGKRGNIRLTAGSGDRLDKLSSGYYGTRGSKIM